MLNKSQQGIGLVEVLVALLLLAVAVMGFSAMQMQAVKATDETLFRSDAMVAIRNISEDLRLYPTNAQKKKYKDYIKKAYEAGQLDANKKLDNPPKICANVSDCNDEEQLKYNVYLSLKLIKDNNLKINALDCPIVNSRPSSGQLQRICLIASWGDTKPTMQQGSDYCIDNQGVYRKGATCFVMETY